MADVSLSCYFQLNADNGTRGLQRKLKKNKFKTDVRKHIFIGGTTAAQAMLQDRE